MIGEHLVGNWVFEWQLCMSCHSPVQAPTRVRGEIPEVQRRVRLDVVPSALQVLHTCASVVSDWSVRMYLFGWYLGISVLPSRVCQ
jgi:hypothetical protein